jgi:hypothetical protein
MPGEAIFTVIIYYGTHAPEKFNTNNNSPPPFFGWDPYPVDVKLKKTGEGCGICYHRWNHHSELSDSTPLHRDNFLRLVKSHFYDSLLFHGLFNIL